MSDDRIIPEQLAELERLHQAATPGRWYAPGEPWCDETVIYNRADPNGATFVAECDPGLEDDDYREGEFRPQDNAVLIVALRNAFPTLAATIRAQAERIAELERMLRERTKDAPKKEGPE